MKTLFYTFFSTFFIVNETRPQKCMHSTQIIQNLKDHCVHI